MTDFNSEKVDYLQLSELCLDICQDKAVKLGDWSERDVQLFVEQFKQAELEPVIDMDKLDPRPYPRSYFEKKFSGFDDNVIDALYECENRKLEDDRLCPLRFLRDKVGTLQISNDTNKYNGDKKDETQNQKAEEGKEDESQSEPETNSYCADRARWFKTAQEEEDED